MPTDSVIMPPFPRNFYPAAGYVLVMWGWFEHEFNTLLRGILNEAGMLEEHTGWESRRFKARRALFRRYGREVLAFSPAIYSHFDKVLHDAVPPSRKRNALVHGSLEMELTIPAGVTLSLEEAEQQPTTRIVATTFHNGQRAEHSFTKADLEALALDIWGITSRMAAYQWGLLTGPEISSSDITRLQTLVANASPHLPTSEAFLRRLRRQEQTQNPAQDG